MFQLFTHSSFVSQVWSTTRDAESGSADAGILLRSYGRVQCDGSFKLEQVPSLYAFHLFEEGAGIFELDGAPYPISQNQMVIVWPGTHVRYYDRPESPWRYRWFTLEGDRVAHALTSIGLNQETPVIDAVNAHPFLEVFARIESSYKPDTVSPFLSTSVAYDLLARLEGMREDPLHERSASVVERAQFIIQQNYQRGLQVEDIARSLDISRATLFRRFREELGISPKEYYDEFRLNQAHILLQKSRSSVKDVAYACGFNCAHYFSNAYKKRFGAAPSRTMAE